MNNYCTNCGKRLEKKELVCKSCNIPIVEIPNDYYYKSPEKEEKKKQIIKVIIICALSLLVIICLVKGINNIRINKLKKEYVEPFLKEEYSDWKYSIEYESSGKCVISGDCFYDPVRGCDGGACSEYKYLDEDECTSYYYKVIPDNEDNFIVTVVKKGESIYVVKGRNIYGEESIEDDEEENTEINREENVKIPFGDIDLVVNEYPYESDYLPFASANLYNTLDLDAKGTKMYFAAGKGTTKKIAISGYVYNPYYYTGKINTTTKYYNINKLEIGTCEETINMGKEYSNVYFSCYTPIEDLNISSIDDIMYFKVFIPSLDVYE